MNEWQYYNHAVVPTGAPHEKPDLKSLQNGDAWHVGDSFPFFARYTTDWDCGYDTGWWYVIKDQPFDLSELKSGYRNKIKKGLKNFVCRRIDPNEYTEEIYRVLYKANETYAAVTRDHLPKAETIAWIRSWKSNKMMVWGAFNSNEELCAYSVVMDNGNWFNMVGQKAIPEFERLQVFAAVLYRMTDDLKEDIEKGKYICNGSRTVSHDTSFNDYLERYFRFRKVYCKLHIEYRGIVKWFIRIVYPFRRILLKLDNRRLFHSVNAVLKMETIARGDTLID